MIHASVFSGIGGPEVAAEMLGWENAFHCEINPFGKAVLDYWFPNAESYENIITTDFKKWRGRIDVLTGGFPCQPFSYAGKRKGAEDDRYLWPQMLRVIDEVRPTWFVGENVAGIRTMVEQGGIVDLGSEGSLFTESDDLHRYEGGGEFTIERICKNLESIGYSVQPIIIPACAIGAPHRRDRIFFIAHTDRCDDLRRAGTDEGKSGEERIQERHSVRKSGESSEVRGIIENPDNLRCRCGEREERDEDGGFGMSCTGSDERICGEENARIIADPHGKRGGEIHEHLQPEFTDGAEPVGNGWVGDAANTTSKGLEWKNESGDSEGRKRKCIWGNITRYDMQSLQPEQRWKSFPSVSPIHRGNDGIPIRLDNLSISFGKWRTESIKAYGNAIVPQVMYEIFRAIEQA